jgi:hypothetical protein
MRFAVLHSTPLEIKRFHDLGLKVRLAVDLVVCVIIFINQQTILKDMRVQRDALAQHESHDRVLLLRRNNK